jgi:hypothetical protein
MMRNSFIISRADLFRKPVLDPYRGDPIFRCPRAGRFVPVDGGHAFAFGSKRIADGKRHADRRDLHQNYQQRQDQVISHMHPGCLLDFPCDNEKISSPAWCTYHILYEFALKLAECHCEE